MTSYIRFNVRVVIAAIKILNVMNKKIRIQCFVFISKSTPQKLNASVTV